MNNWDRVAVVVVVVAIGTAAFGLLAPLRQSDERLGDLECGTALSVENWPTGASSSEAKNEACAKAASDRRLVVGGVSGLVAVIGVTMFLISPANESPNKRPSTRIGGMSANMKESRQGAGSNTKRMSTDDARDLMIRHMSRNRIPETAAMEVAYAIYPDASTTLPSQPTIGDRKTAAKLVFDPGFGRAGLERVVQLLWGMTADEYFTSSEDQG